MACRRGDSNRSPHGSCSEATSRQQQYWKRYNVMSTRTEHARLKRQWIYLDVSKQPCPKQYEQQIPRYSHELDSFYRPCPSVTNLPKHPAQSGLSLGACLHCNIVTWSRLLFCNAEVAFPTAISTPHGH